VDSSSPMFPRRACCPLREISMPIAVDGARSISHASCSCGIFTIRKQRDCNNAIFAYACGYFFLSTRARNPLAISLGGIGRVSKCPDAFAVWVDSLRIVSAHRVTSQP
jgi:hypothetical protein